MEVNVGDRRSPGELSPHTPGLHGNVDHVIVGSSGLCLKYRTLERSTRIEDAYYLQHWRTYDNDHELGAGVRCSTPWWAPRESAVPRSDIRRATTDS